MDWQESDGKLERLFVFPDFKAALAFVNKVGEVAEQLQHHPDITIQRYKEVLVSTTTHDAGNTVTEKDRLLTKEIDGLLEAHFRVNAT
jgi:4a-hydroxytetrahydrobiopterin dehydratase